MRTLLAVTLALVQLVALGRPTAADEPTPAPPDPAVARLLAAVSPDALRATDARLVAFGTRNTFSTDAGRTRGVLAARNWIAAQFRALARASSGRLTVAFDGYLQPKTDRTPRAVTVSSVVATLRGDDPDGRTYVISSHFDSRNTDNNDAVHDAPGADDNASAVAAVLEAARLMVREHFPATIIFAAYDGEEQGLWGSEHHAAMLKDDAIPVDGDLNSDIIGASRGHDGVAHPATVRVYAPALTDVSSPSGELARFAKLTVERYEPGFTVELISRADRIGRGGDQLSFQDHGFPAVRFVEASEDYDHQHQDVRVEDGRQYGDLLQYEDFDYLARVTRGLIATLAELSLGPARPRSATQIVGRDFAYDATLRWTGVPAAVSYEVVWRSTTSSVWQGAQNVGNVETAMIPGLSRDRYVFGVRAVDVAGRRSVVSDCSLAAQ